MSCLFEALCRSHACVGGLTASSLREMICDFLAGDPVLFDKVRAREAVLWESGVTLERYVESMRRYSTWGGATEIRAFAVLFGTAVDIVVLRTGKKVEFRSGHFKIEDLKAEAPAVRLAYTGGHYELLPSPAPAQIEKATLFLAEPKDFFPIVLPEVVTEYPPLAQSPAPFSFQERRRSDTSPSPLRSGDASCALRQSLSSFAAGSSCYGHGDPRELPFRRPGAPPPRPGAAAETRSRQPPPSGAEASAKQKAARSDHPLAPPLRALSHASVVTLWTARRSLPSTRTPGMPYPFALAAIERAAVCAPTGMEIDHWLF